MRIGFFTETYLPNKDGVVRSITETKKALEEKGHEVFIFAPRKINIDEKNTFLFRSFPFPLYADYRISYPLFISSKIAKLKLDVIHTHGMAGIGLAGLRIAKKLKIPIVGTFHTHIPTAVKHYLSRRFANVTESILWRYMAWYFNQCNGVIAPSEVIREDLERNGIRNIHVIPTGVDIKKFRILKNVKKERTILYVGRIAKEKNIDILLGSAPHVISKLKGYKFIIVGVGPHLEPFQNDVMTKNLGEYFLFKGRLGDEDLVKEYNKASCLVFPSKFETQGLVAIEAMACGTPVAGSNFLAIKEYVKNGFNGYLFDPDDSRDCADKIMKTIRNRNRLKAGALSTSRQYSINKMAKKLERLYSSLVKK